MSVYLSSEAGGLCFNTINELALALNLVDLAGAGPCPVVMPMPVTFHITKRVDPFRFLPALPPLYKVQDAPADGRC